ncbi:MAG: hypothetical protein HFG80_05245 [Eubacterium sp.]|nr:hypothetical protein [Eubacterium sp.]
MSYMILVVFMAFIVWLAIRIRQTSKKESDVEKNFWIKENQANQTRKQDISNLDYIKIELEKLPLYQSEDPVLKNCEEIITELSEKQILNLTGISNTELKLQYGVANLNILSECDENFTQLIRCLNNWGSRLSELNMEQDAVAVYEYAVKCRSDITATWLSLAQLYLSQGQAGKIRELTKTASTLNSLSRKTILEKLNQMAV